MSSGMKICFLIEFEMIEIDLILMTKNKNKAL